jgi:transposase-like protein
VADSDPFKWRHNQDEIILLCVRWYLRYALSYRDLEEMMRERGLWFAKSPSALHFQRLHQAARRSYR